MMLRSTGLYHVRSRLLPRGSTFASPPILAISSSKARPSKSREMCGLVAAIDDVWSSSSSSSRLPPTTTATRPIPILTNKLVLQNTTSILNHRGPDGSCVSMGTFGNVGSVIGGGDRSAVAAARWAMGHTRLAIVDPTSRAADMPFNLSITTQATTTAQAHGDGGSSTSTSTMKLHLVANGEIYNHVQLYDQLIMDGWDSNNRISNSDCEVIAHLFAYYGGNKTVQLLDGMFAFVIFAEEEQEDSSSSSSSSTASGSGKQGVQVFAARDPVGIKPLYYGRTTSSSNEDNDGNNGGAAYVFASELKALVGHVESSTIVALPPGHYWSNSTTSSNNSNSTKMKTMKRK